MFNAPYSLHLPSLWNEKGRGTELYILSRESEKKGPEEEERAAVERALEVAGSEPRQ